MLAFKRAMRRASFYYLVKEPRSGLLIEKIVKIVVNVRARRTRERMRRGTRRDARSVEPYLTHLRVRVRMCMCVFVCVCTGYEH